MSRRRRKSAPSERDLWGALYPTVDLHGRTADEAVRIAERWITARRAEGERVVRVITGRGLHSVGPPVLPTVVEQLLTRLTPRDVTHFTREAGGGVFRVHLKKPDIPPPAPIDHSPADPELVRRAEEALAELGIDPTASLIATEINRILREENNGER